MVSLRDICNDDLFWKAKLQKDFSGQINFRAIPKGKHKNVYKANIGVTIIYYKALIRNQGLDMYIKLDVEYLDGYSQMFGFQNF